MPLNKANGNMYSWVTHTHTHLSGQCPHRCTYCYVQDIERRFKRGRYSGPLRLKEKELEVNYGSGKTIFIDNCNDLFATEVPDEWIRPVLAHCRKYPDNTYVFQTKNPRRYHAFIDLLPPRRMLGCTIESTADLSHISAAPPAFERAHFMRILPVQEQKFITIEPIIYGDMRLLVEWLIEISPDFVNIGADSKNRNLAEPAKGDFEDFLETLEFIELEIRQKSNLDRLLKGTK